MSNLRFQVVEEAFKKRPLEVEVPKERPSEYFGKYVFTRAKMYKYLPPPSTPSSPTSSTTARPSTAP